MSKMSQHRSTEEALLTSGEVATLFRVEPATVTRWTRNGHLTSILTPGGHHRYRASEVRALLASEASAEGVSA